MPELVLFEQNYSTMNQIPDNIFAADPLVHTRQPNYTLSYNSTKKAIEFYSWTGNTYKLYVGKLFPSPKTTIRIKIDLDRDNWNSNINIYSPVFWVKLQKRLGDITRIYSYYYEDSTLTYEYQETTHGGPYTLLISYDSEANKITVTLEEDQSINIQTPPTYESVSKLNYPSLSGTYIVIENIVSSLGNWVKTYLYEIKQTIPRSKVTAIPRNNLQAYGFDGPHPYNTVHNGMEYLKSKGFRATLWLDVNYEWRSDANVKSYYQDLVNNYGWEAGIHYSKKLNDLSMVDAEQLMINEYNTVCNDFGVCPTSWGSLANADSVEHANYAYSNLNKIIWRNSDWGVKGVTNIGGLNDNYWYFWDVASQHGFVHPCFSHQTDLEPAEERSLSWSNFTTWVDRMEENGNEIVPFVEFYYINRNQIDFRVTDASRYGFNYRFTAHTNGCRAYVDVSVSPTKTTIVWDLTENKEIPWYSGGGVQFWVEDGHTYEIRDCVEIGTVKYGHLRKWLHFKGEGDYTVIPNSPSLNPSSVTVIALVKVLDYTRTLSFIFSKEGAYELEIHPTNRYIHFNRWIGGTKLWNYTAQDTLPSEGVIFLAATYDENWEKPKIYINEQSYEVDGNEQSGALDSSDNPITIAKPPWGNVWMNANVYFLAEYNRALSDAENTQMCDYVMNGKREMITDGLVLWYDGDSIDIANGKWLDKSGNGNDGTIYGAIYNSNWGEVKYGTIHYGA